MSIQRQTFQDFSVIISDDCSPEPIYSVVLPFLSDSRFSYRRNNENIGAEHLVSHWNLLLGECHSPYLIMAGDDDSYEPSFLEEMDKLVTRYREVNLFRSRMDVIDQSFRITQTEKPFDEFEEMTAFVNDMFKEHLHGIGQYIFKTDYLTSLGGFKYFPLAWFSDDATAILCSNHGTAHSHEILFHLRNSGLNISTISNNILFDELKCNATVAFYQWFRKLHLSSDYSYCYSKLGEIWGRLPLSYRFKTLWSVPGFTSWRIKNSFNSLFKRAHL